MNKEESNVPSFHSSLYINRGRVCARIRRASPSAVIEDLFDQITLLEVQVTLNGQAIADNSNAIISLEADVSLLEADVVQIQNDLAANVALDVVQSGQIAAIDGRVTTVETQTLINTGAIATLDVRLDANDALDSVQSTQIASIDGRVTAVETQTGINTGAIATLDVRLTANDARDDGQDLVLNDHEQRLDGHDVQLASHDGRLTANDARDDGQDTRLDRHDLLLVEHDARIWTAQNTANAAAADAADLRGAVVAGRIGLVQQASYSAPITVGAATGGDYVSLAGQAGDRRLGGVAAGVNGNDAVNLSQMQLADATTLDQARAYTDTSLANFGFDLGRLSELMQYNDRELRQEIDAASAGAAALAGLPQAFEPGRGMVAIGMGGRGSTTAFAIGVGKAFDGPNTPVLRAGAAIDARRGDITYNAAVGFHF